MKQRWRRLIHGQECRFCHRVRRVKWYSDTGCCSFDCLNVAMMFMGMETFEEWKAKRP